MAAHAKTPTRKLIDPAIAYLTLAVAFFRLTVRLLVGAVTPPRREVQWPTGADEQWAEFLHRENETPVMREEVRV